MKSLIQAGPDGRVPAPPEKRFLIRESRAEENLDRLDAATRSTICQEAQTQIS